MQTAAQHIMDFITLYGLKVLGAIIILILGRMGAGIGRNLFTRLLEKRRVDPAVISFGQSLVYVLILAFAVIAALAKFGIQTTSFVAVLGAAGLAIGLALQGSLSNFAAGVLILLLKPFRIGDYIDGAGVAGTVRGIHLFTTELATPDNVQIIVPNGKLFGDIIRNFSANDTRRADVTVGIAYGASIQQALEVIAELLKADARVMADPPPQMVVTDLADSSVNLAIRVWVRKDDFWPLKFDLTRGIKEAFDAHGIEIPFPQRVVHVVRPEGV